MSLRTVAVVLPLSGAHIYLDDVPSGRQGVSGSDGVWATDANELPYTYLTVDAIGYKPYRLDALQIPPGNVQLRIGVPLDPSSPAQQVALPALSPLIVGLPDIYVQGDQFVTVDGARWLSKGMTGFLDYQRWLDGEREHIHECWRQTVALGGNLRRVLLQCHYIKRFYPRDYGDRFYADLTAFQIDAAEHGLYLENVVYADEQVIKSGTDHWYLCADAITSANVPGFIELVNEYPKNGINPLDFTRPTVLGRVLFSRGSNVSDTDPPYPAWDYSTYHGRRDEPKWKTQGNELHFIKIGHPSDGGNPAYPGTFGPVVANEPKGGAESEAPGDGDDAFLPGSRSTNAEDFRRYAADCALWGNGGTFHCQDGLRSKLLRPIQQDCARAFYHGLEQGRG